MKEGKLDTSELRTPLFGFDKHAADILQLTNHVIALRMESNPTKAEMIKGPVFPMEIVEKRLADFATRKRTDVIAKSQARWAERQQKRMKRHA